MPKVPDPNKILKAVMQRLEKSGVLDDVARTGGNLADDISKIMSEMTGKAAKLKLPKNPPKSGTTVRVPLPAAKDKPLTTAEMLSEAKSKFPKNPPKSGRGKNPPTAGAVAPAPKGPKPKSPKSGSVNAA